MNTSRALFGIFAVLILAAGYFVYREYLAPVQETPPPPETTPVAQAPQLVSAEGRVVPSGQATLAFTQAGRVSEILVDRGAAVRQGDVLLRLDGDMLEAAAAQAGAAVDTAQANLQAARTRLDQALYAAHMETLPERAGAWNDNQPDEFSQPGWYFEKSMRLESAQAEVDAARDALETEQSDLQSVLDGASSADLLAAEARLARAQAAFLVADEVQERASEADEPDLEEQAERNYENARSELDAAQARYDQLLTSKAAADVLEARARLAVAQERYDTALDRLNGLMTGEESLEIQLARETAAQAEAAVEEALAAREAARLAVEEAALKAPMNGVVASIQVKVGEVVAPGQPMVVVADISTWQVETTDLAESDVVLLSLGMPAAISLDALPGEVFDGTVREIAYLGETNRGQVTYAVTLDFDPRDRPVRWGMTAFVDVSLND